MIPDGTLVRADLNHVIYQTVKYHRPKNSYLCRRMFWRGGYLQDWRPETAVEGQSFLPACELREVPIEEVLALVDRYPETRQYFSSMYLLASAIDEAE